MTNLELGDKDAALIIRDNGTTELLLPGGDENPQLSDSSFLASAFMVRMTEDKEWLEELFDWFEAKLEAYDKTE